MEQHQQKFQLNHFRCNQYMIIHDETAQRNLQLDELIC